MMRRMRNLALIVLPAVVAVVAAAPCYFPGGR